jgi:hypothetical protein
MSNCTSKEEGHVGLGISTIIVARFLKGEGRKPIFLLVGTVCAKLLFKNLIDNFNGAINLRIMCRREVHGNTQVGEEMMPEMQQNGAHDKR